MRLCKPPIWSIDPFELTGATGPIGLPGAGQTGPIGPTGPAAIVRRIVTIPRRPPIWTGRTGYGEKSVAFGNGVYVATGTNQNSVSLSIDAGLTWNSYATPVPSAGNVTWYVITFGAGKFVMLGRAIIDNIIAVSSDGRNWTLSDVGSHLTSSITMSVCWGGGLYVAHFPERIYTSPDAVTWTLVNSDESLDYTGQLCYGIGLFVMTTYAGIQTSADGSVWTPQTIPSFMINRGFGPVSYNGSLFVAMVAGLNDGDDFLTSPDALTWTAGQTYVGLHRWNSLAYGAGYFVAVGQNYGGNSGSVYSVDGTFWYPAATTGSSNLGICFGAIGSINRFASCPVTLPMMTLDV